jgi:solute carrier family 13 (sodium-dependent dicarboxylate transporter), member 2/3/5
MNAKRAGLFAGPLVFLVLLLLPVPAEMTPQAWRVIATAGFMLVWWVTEAVPIPVTALLPIVCLPLLDVSDIRTAAAPYANPVVFLFMGGFMLALAMERWELHKRIALNIVRLTGTNANGILLGFMLATAAISMWISNTATAIMMLPIALSVIELLTRNRSDYPEKGKRNFALSMMLAVAYAANIGGTATIIGTPPNVVFAGFIKQTYGYEVSFAKWMLIGVPFAVILLLFCYLLLVKVLHPNRLGNFAGAGELIRQEVAQLGRMSKGERLTLMVFIFTALAWISRSGINNLIPGLNLSDEGIAMIATVALFAVPENFQEGRFLLKWEDTMRLPWGILLLFGGGLSLAGALSDTGIVELIGNQFEGIEHAGFWVIIGLTTVSLLLTEVMSNVALVTMFLPVVAGIAGGMEINPLLVCIPVTLAGSCAFMFPMSTPPNAIVFASGYLTIPQMVRAGVLLNILSILLIALLSSLFVDLVF